MDHSPNSSTLPSVEEHPHRGFETVICYQVSIDHRGFADNSGTIDAGDV